MEQVTKMDQATWNNVFSTYGEAMNFSCKPKMVRLRKGQIIDENKSVKWNREEIERNHKEYDAEVANLNRQKNKLMQEAKENVLNLIKEEVNFSISTETANLIFEKSWEDKLFGGLVTFKQALIKNIQFVNSIKEFTKKLNRKSQPQNN